MKTKNNGSTMKKVLRYIGKYWFFLLCSIVCAALTVTFTLYIPILTGDAVDAIIGPGQVDFTVLLEILKKMGIAILLAALTQWIMSVCNNRIAYHVVQDIRKDAFDKIQILPLKYLDAHPYGEIVSRVIADVDQFSDGLILGFVHRCPYHFRNPDFHVPSECGHYTGGYLYYTCQHAGGKLHCEKDIPHV